MTNFHIYISSPYRLPRIVSPFSLSIYSIDDVCYQKINLAHAQLALEQLIILNLLDFFVWPNSLFVYYIKTIILLLLYREKYIIFMFYLWFSKLFENQYQLILLQRNTPTINLSFTYVGNLIIRLTLMHLEYSNFYFFKLHLT